MSRPYAEVIGDPVAHSKSPLIHGFWLAKLGMAAEYRRCRVRADELPGYFGDRRGDPAWRGCNVTMPHKLAVAGLVDGCDGRVAEVEAINTVHRADGTLRGTNTDVDGITEPLLRFPVRAAKPPTYPLKEIHSHLALIVGAGGAARAAAGGALAAGWNPFFFNRTVEGAREMSRIFRGHAGDGFGLEELVGPNRVEGHPGHSGAADQPHFAHYLLVNASAMGMTGYPALPIDMSTYPDDTIVFDLVYSPLETPLLTAARQHGLRTIDGLQMLVAQAAAAFALFFGAPAPREHDAELRAILTA